MMLNKAKNRRLFAIKDKKRRAFWQGSGVGALSLMNRPAPSPPEGLWPENFFSKTDFGFSSRNIYFES